MLTVNIYQAKTNFSHYLDLVQKGKTVIIAKRNVPFAKISRVENVIPKRAIGQCEEKFVIPQSFFEPLPESVLDEFNNPR